MTVLSGIAKHMTGILKEKEQNTGIGRQNRNWLTTEATKPENLNRAGTFRLVDLYLYLIFFSGLQIWPCGLA